MAYLVVGSTVPVALGGSQRTEVPIGEVRRAFSGAPRSSVSGYKREWSVETAWMTRAAADTLRTALKGTPPVSVSGDLTGSISVYVQNIRTVGSDKGAAGEFTRLAFDLLEA